MLTPRITHHISDTRTTEKPCGSYGQSHIAAGLIFTDIYLMISVYPF